MSDFNLVKIQNPFDVSKKDIEVLPVAAAMTVRNVVDRADLGKNVIVIRNGRICEDFWQPVFPNDIIHVLPKIGDDAVKTISTIALIAAVAYYAPGAGGALAQTFGGTQAVWSSVFTFVTLTAGGMLLNSLMPPPATPSLSFNSSAEESPTYGWNIDRNTAEEGLAIPVIYGLVRSLPQLINFYLEIDSGGNQWVHMLLSIAEGLTSNVPTADDIYAGDELLSSFEESDYELYATDGGNNPDTNQLVKFDKLHQFRPLKKILTADNTANLLHFNGSDGSTTIEDESIFDGIWECQGTADLSTAHPWGGTANLDLTNAVDDYLKYSSPGQGYKNWDIFVVDVWDIELRFRQPSLVDAGICGQHLDLSGYPSYGYNYEMFWSIIYDNTGGNLLFQQYKYDHDTSAYTVYFNISGSVSLSVDTWYHIRVARSGDTVYLFLDGSLVASGAYSNEPEEHGFTGTWYQGLGRAYWYTTGPEAHTLTYAQAEIDEFQFKREALIYDTLTDFAPATEEAVSPELGVYGVTNGMVDELTFIIEASYGLYWVSATDGSLGTLYVHFDIMYRLKGETSWTIQSVSISGKTRYPVKKQFSYTMSERGIFEFRVVRKTPNFTGSSWQARTHWTGLDEMLDEFLSYPNLQLVSISLKAQDDLNTTVPTIRIVNNRTKIEIPVLGNMDPRINAYAAYDMLSNTLYGGGVDPGRFDETDWQAWIDWCNGSVDGNPRCQFNMIMDAQYSMDEALQHVENTGRAKIVMRGTRISVSIEKPASPSFLFSSGNIIQGSSKLSILPRSDRSDAVEISFKDKDLNWSDNKAFFPGTGYETLNRVPKIVRLTLPGINNYEQALREAIFRQQLSENIKWSMTLESGIEGITVTVPDVVRFAQDVFGGRLAADSAGGSIRIDQTIILDSATYSGNCKIWIKTSNDTILEGVVSGPFDQETNLLNTSISSAVSRFDNYMIGLADNTKYIYRIVNVTRSGQKRVAVTGLQYVESSFYHQNYGGGAVAI